MNEKQTREKLLEIVAEKSWSKCLEAFKENVTVLDAVESLPATAPTRWGELVIKILRLRRDIRCKNLKAIRDIPEQDLYESSVKLDLFTAILINYHFKLNKEMHAASDALYFSLLSFHKELGHSECVSVLVNICLKILIQCGKWNLCIENVPGLEHQGLYFYYTGYMHLVNQRYAEALRDFKHSTILRSSLVTEACVVVTSLLLSENYKPKKYRQLLPYVELKCAVEKGDYADFERVLREHGHVFDADRLLFIVQRLDRNVAEQNIKKIKKVYSRIDTSSLAKMGVCPELVASSSDVAVFRDADRPLLDIESRISESEMLIAKIASLMRYREVEPLCYETVNNAAEHT